MESKSPRLEGLKGSILILNCEGGTFYLRRTLCERRAWTSLVKCCIPFKWWRLLAHGRLSVLWVEKALSFSPAGAHSQDFMWQGGQLEGIEKARLACSEAEVPLISSHRQHCFFPPEEPPLILKALQHASTQKIFTVAWSMWLLILEAAASLSGLVTSSGNHVSSINAWA